jgi:hypothetical protein
MARRILGQLEDFLNRLKQSTRLNANFEGMPVGMFTNAIDRHVGLVVRRRSLKWICFTLEPRGGLRVLVRRAVLFRGSRDNN